MKYRIVKEQHSKTHEKRWVIEKKNFLGLWFYDWDFYSPFFYSIEEAERALLEVSGEYQKVV
jgi:hypothetical protein